MSESQSSSPSIPPGNPSPGLTDIAAPIGRSPAYAAPAATDERPDLEREFLDVQRVCIFFGAMLLPLLALAAWCFHTKSNDLEAEFIGAGAFYAIIAGFAIAWRGEWATAIRLPVEWSKCLFLLTVATPLCSIAAAHMLGIASSLIELPVHDITAGFGEGGYPVWLLFVWSSMLPALFEEIAFRGVLLSKLQRLMSATQAIWVCSLLFGILHFSLVSMAVFLVPVAAVAGYVTRRTGSLLPAICIHAIHNAGVISLELFARWG